jgi:uncharacterized protein YbcC (UPF0753/DUF2309 family)
MVLKDHSGDPATRHAASATSDGQLRHLKEVIDHAAHLLPAQGPITVFIHHNTLHAFEDLPFHDAVKKGAKVFGCQPYLTEERFRAELGRGRIRLDELREVLRADLGTHADEKVAGLGTRLGLRLAMLEHPLRFGPTEELLWFVAETDALRHVRPEGGADFRARLIAETRDWALRELRDRASAAVATLFERFGDSRVEAWGEDTWEAFALQALWRVCCDGVAGIPAFTVPPQPSVRHRDLLLEATGEDADLPVHELLTRFCAAFLDQGLAHWQLPRRGEGFYRSFCALYRQPGGPPDPWRRGLATELARLENEKIGALKSVHESLQMLRVPEREWESYISATLLALRGWAGITRFLEERPDRAVQAVPDGSLVGLLAVRLVLDRIALAHTARCALGFVGTLDTLRDELRKRVGLPQPPSEVQRAFLVFQLAEVLGWTPEQLHGLGELNWSMLLQEIETFSAVERRRVFHLAYEHRFYTQTLNAIALHTQTASKKRARPRLQAIFCIDEREESIRRHLEEVAPDAVTFGTAGFFALAMYYRGADDAHFVPLCPAIIRPHHWVAERPINAQEEAHQRRLRLRRVLGLASHQLHVGSRTFAVGALLAAAVGVLASIPLVTRTLFPRLTAKIRKVFARFVGTAARTRLQLERATKDPGPENGAVGFTPEEMIDIAERVLRDTGLTAGFAPLVLIFGHGSTSMNNPHESAHDCGACGGACGGPNARALAQILNDPRVRERLGSRGIAVPTQTVFVGAMHNTSSEAVTYFDLDRLPESHWAEFEAVRDLMEEVCDRDAHERCRRFESAPLTFSFEEARRHVEGRAEDLAQVRPEWGHATNAICIVGRRERTRGLFLDRRAFLNSYDPTQDDADATILTRILHAAVPVCGGINLEYYFSYVDNAGFGCGTKLPHNIAALLGVMDGAASDLRTGLPWQMVEIHEPVRLLFVIETRPETLLRVMDKNPAIGKLISNGWVRVAILDPDTPTIRFFRDGTFHDYHPRTERLPRAASSVEWYCGRREHLEFAEIGERWGEPCSTT